MEKNLLSKTPQSFGFSLLEVLIALAIASISFTALLMIQARSTNLAAQARDISIATMLARYQLSECKKEAQKAIPSVSDYKSEGDFADLGFEKFTFECHAPKYNMKTPSSSDIEKPAKQAAPEEAKKNIKG